MVFIRRDGLVLVGLAVMGDRKMANQGDRYRRRNRFSRRRNNRVWRWVALLLVVLLAFLWLFPLPNTQKDGITQNFSSAGYEQTAENGLEGGDEQMSERASAENAASMTAVTQGSAAPEVVVINSSINSVNTYAGDGVSVAAGEVIDSGSSGQGAARYDGDAIRDVSGNELYEATSSAEEFDFSRWGYANYDAYAADHPFWARFNYARLWTGRALEMIQPAGCSSCARQENQSEVMVEERSAINPRPITGQIFQTNGQGRLPQLTIVAPLESDAFVKLRNIDSGETVLAFYVRSGTTVEACVPAVTCEFYYAMGSDWLGPDEAFGEEGVYAKSDCAFDFADPTREYTYTFGSDGGNVDPAPIPWTEFI